MKWKFWGKSGTSGSTGKAEKLPRPKDIPQGIGMTMVTALHNDLD